MTTTSDTILLTEKDKQRLEKIIEVSKAALEGQEIECFEYNGANKSWHQANCVCWNWRDYDYRIKPPDPEPLECWVAHQDGNIIGASKSEPEVAGRVEKTFMREVTPQDKENELDAKRYRKLKDLHCATAPDWIYTPWQWDRQLDKAMEK